MRDREVRDSGVGQCRPCVVMVSQTGGECECLRRGGPVQWPVSPRA